MRIHKKMLSPIFKREAILTHLALIIMLMLSITTYAQSHSVSGTVKDGSGEPLIGVSVQIKGNTTQGTITDLNGKFSINAQANATLVLSYIGYDTQLIPATKAFLDVVMQGNSKNLDDVVVVGYGTAKRSDLTGSLSSVSSDDIRKEPVTNFGQAIQGHAPGVVVSNNSGAPGSLIKIRIRGSNSLLGSNDPLYIVDGIALEDINSIDVNDIESVEILKDASATAVYGSRGSNGVILISTKAGKAGAIKVQCTFNTGISTLPNRYDVLNGYDYANLVNTIHPGTYSPTDVAYYKTNGGVNWQNVLFQTGITKDFQANASGGTNSLRYFVSLNYLDQTGILLRTSQTKYAFRSNISSDIGKRIKFDFNVSGVYGKCLNTLGTDGSDASTNLNNGGLYSAIFEAPIFSPAFKIYSSPGVWNRLDQVSGPNVGNPLMGLMNEYSDATGKNLILNSKLSYVITNDLKFEILFGSNILSNQYGGIANHIINPSTQSASLVQSNTFTWQNSNILTYHKKIGEIHDLTIMAANEQSKFDYSGFSATGVDLSPISVGYDNLGLASIQTISSNHTQYSLQSYLGRVSYSLLDRYLLTASYRADGTSKFQGKNKWGYFPSAALAWRVTEEPFLKDKTIISNLKVRASFGVTGNQGVPVFATDAKIGPQLQTFGLSQALPGAVVNGVDNPNLKWESTAQQNIGLDLSVLKGRIGFSFDYYVKNTSDMLYGVLIPIYQGGGTVNENIGKMQNKGFEMTLTATPVVTHDFRWDASFNISSYKNKVVSLGKDTVAFGNNTYAAGLTTQSPFVIKTGESLGSFWGYTWEGVYKTSEAAEAAKYGFKPGDNKFLDYNGDGKIDSKDEHVIGNAMPKFVWGFSNSLSYKNWQLNFMLQAVVGRKILNTVYACANTIFSQATAISGKDGANYWKTGTNENAQFADPTSSTNQNIFTSTQFLQDGSYIKLKNIALAYTLKKDVIKFADVKLSVSAQNIFCITKYKGYDPETSTSTNDFDGAIDSGAYPNPRTVTFSLQANF